MLDENSQDDFDKWFKLSTQEKWKIENPSHMWEISCGHTHTMIHLYLFWDGGYIPNNDMGWRYWYGGFPKDDVINFVQLSDGNSEAVIKNATWFDIDDVKLADK